MQQVQSWLLKYTNTLDKSQFVYTKNKDIA